MKFRKKFYGNYSCLNKGVTFLPYSKLTCTEPKILSFKKVCSVIIDCLKKLLEESKVG